MGCSGQRQLYSFDLYVKGEVPKGLEGSIVVTVPRRHKDRTLFSRWHDSPTDLMRLDLKPGRPGDIRATVFGVDSSGADLGEGFSPSEYERRAFGEDPSYGYATQPNHGLNLSGDTVWATNLLYGAPLEVRLSTLEPRRILRYVEPCRERPRLSSTSHFAYSLDGRYAYFHQSLLEQRNGNDAAKAVDLKLVELDTRSGSERVWDLLPPAQDKHPEGHNFHSVFYYEEAGDRYVGMLRTGAVVDSLSPQAEPSHPHFRMEPSSIWTVKLDDECSTLQAELLPQIGQLDGLALSHLDIDNSSGDGFVLYANYKEAVVGDETKGANVYGEPPDKVLEHYSGMIVEGINYGQVIRYQKDSEGVDLKVFQRDYCPEKSSLGHTWLPINIELDESREYLFCTFSGFHPRLLPKHVAEAYPERTSDYSTKRFIPPLLMRLRADSLEPDFSPQRDYLSYTEPVAICVAGKVGSGHVCTFSPERGLRVYPAHDLSRMVCHAESVDLRYWGDDCFRPDPAHMIFARR